MIQLSNATPLLAVGLAIILAALGLLFLVSPSRAFVLSGHRFEALPGVMGGRYVGLAILIMGLLWLGDTRALVLAFTVGAGFGFLDACLTAKVGGKVVTHIGAGLVSLALAFAFGAMV